MSKPIEMAKAMLVVIVGPYELSGSLEHDIKEWGARGFTTTQVSGHGAHGPRKYGVLDGGNVRFEIIAKPALASKILDHVATRFTDRPVVACAWPIEAVPADHFA
jgi:nitrogen regulatory protein P-II 2